MQQVYVNANIIQKYVKTKSGFVEHIQIYGVVGIIVKRKIKEKGNNVAWAAKPRIFVST